MVTPVPILIVGPSGVGKNAIIDRILPMFTELESYKTTTSRPKRTPTEDKYHFVSEAAFKRLIETGGMLEWTETHGHRYGVQRAHIQAVLDDGKYPIARNGIDVKGVPAYQQLFPGTLAIFITVESLDQLAQRIRRTRLGTPEMEIATRLATAREEMAALDQFTHVVVNQEGKLDDAVEEVAQIIERELGLQRKGEAA
ncbi:hypothetical protein HY374_01580 [Candidatus Berkelbacteria bacterium]|nr:hypothetical protein [Candidatus Berkelbacteria bacterium]